MGPPDLKDTVADPNHPGSTVGRYVWLDSGQVAIFDDAGRIATLQRVAPVQRPAATAEAQAARPTPSRPFDPLETPLNYATFPLKAAVIYGAAGLQCLISTGPCVKPQLPYPS